MVLRFAASIGGSTDGLETLFDTLYQTVIGSDKFLNSLCFQFFADLLHINVQLSE